MNFIACSCSGSALYVGSGRIPDGSKGYSGYALVVAQAMTLIVHSAFKVTTGLNRSSMLLLCALTCKQLSKELW